MSSPWLFVLRKTRKHIARICNNTQLTDKEKLDAILREVTLPVSTWRHREGRRVARETTL